MAVALHVPNAISNSIKELPVRLGPNVVLVQGAWRYPRGVFVRFCTRSLMDQSITVTRLAVAWGAVDVELLLTSLQQSVRDNHLLREGLSPISIDQPAVEMVILLQLSRGNCTRDRVTHGAAIFEDGVLGLRLELFLKVHVGVRVNPRHFFRSHSRVGDDC